MRYTRFVIKVVSMCVHLASCDWSVSESQQLVSERDQGFEATLAPGRRPTSASGRATVGRCGDRVETASMPSWEIRWVNVVQCSNMEEATWRYRRQGGGRGWSLIGEVVPRCGAGSLMKIVVWESMCQGVMGVQVGTSSQHRVRDSSLWPSACLCEDRCSWSKWRLRDCPWRYHHGRRRCKRASIKSSMCLDERIRFKYEGAVNQWRGVSSTRTCLYMRLEWMV
jgi:hypothetical protein